MSTSSKVTFKLRGRLGFTAYPFQTDNSITNHRHGARKGSFFTLIALLYTTRRPNPPQHSGKCIFAVESQKKGTRTTKKRKHMESNSKFLEPLVAGRHPDECHNEKDRIENKKNRDIQNNDLPSNHDKPARHRETPVVHEKTVLRRKGR